MALLKLLNLEGIWYLMAEGSSRLDLGWEKGALLESLAVLGKAIQPSKLVVITDDLLLIKETMKSFQDSPLIIVTSHKISKQPKDEKRIRVRRLPRPLSTGLEILRQTEDTILSICADGTVDVSDRILCLVSADISSIFTFTADRIGILDLFRRISDRVDIQVIQTVMHLAAKIITEGKEGHPAGALFIVGDSGNVTRKENVIPTIMNPFEGHERKCSILDDENWSTIIQFATLDGATLIDEDGCAIAAGTYIQPSMECCLMGYGGRHLAAASITKRTRAIGVLISSSGIISVFKDGDEIYRDHSMTRTARYTERSERQGEDVFGGTLQLQQVAGRSRER